MSEPDRGVLADTPQQEPPSDPAVELRPTSATGATSHDPTSDIAREGGWCAGASTAGGRWSLRYDRFEPELEGTREALCTLGNGYWATRGAAAEASADTVHYPGTYLAGVYNRLRSELGGRTV